MRIGRKYVRISNLRSLFYSPPIDMLPCEEVNKFKSMLFFFVLFIAVWGKIESGGLLIIISISIHFEAMLVLCINIFIYYFKEKWFKITSFVLSKFTVDNLRYQWDDGIFSITLGNRQPDGYRIAYFHAMARFVRVFSQFLENDSIQLYQWCPWIQID